MSEEAESADTLADLRRYSVLKSVAYKTVDMFSGITKRRLWLKDGSFVGTDGNEIRVPFSDPDFYQLVERQLAHVLFRSDAKAKKVFVRDYSMKVAEVAKKMGVELNAGHLQGAIGHIITVLEKRRVTSLWGILYPGSHQLLKEIDQESVAELMNEAHGSLLAYLTCLEGDGASVGAGEMDRFRPYIEEAFRKVHKRGFSATLSISKWLVMQFVNEIIRELKDIPPPPPPMPTPQGQPGSAGSSGENDSEREEGDDCDCDAPKAGGSSEGSGEEGDEGSQEPSEGDDGEGEGDAPDEGDEGQEGASEGEEDGDGDAPWNPPPPPATGAERTQALKDLIDKLGKAPEQVKDTMLESKFTKSRHSPKAQALASQALKADVNNPDKFEDSLDDSEQEMEDILDAALRAMRQKMHHDEWLQKDAMAKISFVDKEDQKHARQPMSFEDQQTVNRLRAMFHRVMGKRKSVLEYEGTEIDVSAYIERMTTGLPVPCFRSEGTGRGFKALLLLDRSSSMGGAKTQQCERAGRIIRRALEFPFVETTVWGFSSNEPGQISLIRHNSRADVELREGERGSGGSTPLHVAVRLGVRELERGTESKQLFVLTDGFPTHAKRNGKIFATEQLMLFVRDEVRKARSKGINVTCVLVGAPDWRKPDQIHYDMSPKQLSYMFGPRRNWRQMDPERVGSDLVHLVATSFVDFLKRG